MKVVWLCHFANQEMKDYFDNQQIRNFAPWISELISIFKNKDEIELHIIAPNWFTNDDVHFCKDNIDYHYYRVKNTSNQILNKITNGYLTNFWYIKRKIKKIVNQIRPNIIHLHGAENPYCSAGILPLINKYPTLVTIQGFARKETIKGFFNFIRCKIEKKILERANHFGYRADFMIDYLREFNPKASFYYHLYPINNSIRQVKFEMTQAKIFDIVFYGRVCKDKGIEDLIAAVKSIVVINPDIKVLIIGGITNKYQKNIIELISKIGLKRNFVFKPFFPSQSDLFEAIKEAKIYVLPTHADILTFTIPEAMFLKIPVISYNIEGIRDFNKNNENIYLVEKKNISELTKAILFLLSNEPARIKLTDSAYNFADKFFNSLEIYNDLINAYTSIINISKNN